jgi:3-hydroxyisobutyrate dehydrogenase-like beta-hydroxyacid dehydrogenase
VAQLGFLGLGIMGYPMAQHLLAAGHEVALWSHTTSKVKTLAKEGKGTVCATPREVAQRSDVIFYCVGDTDMARQITLRKDGLLEGIRKDSVTCDCSTISPAASKEIGKAFEAKGAHFLESPVTGSKPGAEKGTLTFMIGGDKAIFERVKPYMELMGKLFYYCGGPGMGLAAKLTQNLIGATIFQAFSEGMVLATKAGVAPELMLEILENSAARSGLASFKAPFILNRDFQPNFSTKWMHKDIGMALDSGRTLNVPLPVSALTHQMLGATIARGWGEDDFCSAIRVLEEFAGTVVKKS